MRLIVRILCLISFVFAQWNISGSIHPISLNRTSDGSSISLPFRIAELEVGYSDGDFELITQSAMEYRWSGGEEKVDIREAYMIWYPSWGEVKVGKQIHAWGAVDGNNPTDNLNPYDYYYMFLPGTDRKIGTLSASVKYYWNDWQLEAIVIPEHEGNRIPFDEPDFPISQSTDDVDPRESMKENKTDVEYGIKIGSTLGNNDINIYYFIGRDRSFSLGGYDETFYIDMYFLVPRFSYRRSAMLGIDLVTFIGEMTFRGEVALFNTKNDLTYEYKNNIKATYRQFAFQLEYLTEDDHIISAQLIGNEIINVDGEVYFLGMEIMDRKATKDDLSIGMGTPFAIFTERGAMISFTGNYWDSTLELRLNTFMDLKDSQQMFGWEFSYSPKENWEIVYGFSIFKGEEGTQFREMEDFSHSTMGMKYSF